MIDRDEENRLVARRREKLEALRNEGNAFPNDFRRSALAGDLERDFGDLSGEALQTAGQRVAVAGRLMVKRVMGKASFAKLQDVSGQIQLFLQRDALPATLYQAFKGWDIGDIVGAEGELFRTRTGELTVRVDMARLLVKSLRPLPEKFHGLADQEQRYRQRHLDLIVNPDVRRTFYVRCEIIRQIRHFFDARGFMEVETPMMQALAGGAMAKPFVTHHNALDMTLFLRIAPELYLKRLVVGGFERVYEINRNFRNEGISTRHNPEFTMLEFYEAFATYEDAMDLTEQLIRGLAAAVLGTTTLRYQGAEFDLAMPFARMTLLDSILHFNATVARADLEEHHAVSRIAENLGIEINGEWGVGKIQTEIFEKTVEGKLTNPTFITAYPTEVSPLARRSDNDPAVTDRFEFFIAGREIANGFSELNDYEDQAERFREQVRHKNAGDHEAMHFDGDYIATLEQGLPPTAGEGIGIDRLVMLFTDSPSIRDVILFPLMRRSLTGD